MRMYLEAQGKEIEMYIENGPFVTTTIINNVEQAKVKGSLSEDDKNKVLFDRKVKNILA